MRRNGKRRAIIAANASRHRHRSTRHPISTMLANLATKTDKRRRRLRRLAWVLAAALFADSILVVRFLGWSAANMPPPLPDVPHAAGVVFFNDFGDAEGLGPGSMARIEYAADLFAAGKVQRIICVGGQRAQRAQSGAALMAAALVRRGVPAERVQHDTQSFDTLTNWRSAQASLTPAEANDPLLVSAPLHLLRIRHVTGGVGTPAPTASIPQELHRRGVAIWLDVHREWLAWGAAALLPADLYRHWVKRWRDFWDNPPPTNPAHHKPSTDE
jgi:vancomycin permeability regulator SanA